MNTSAAILSTSILHDKRLLSTSVRGIVTDVSKESVTINSGAREIMVSLDSGGELKKGDTVVLIAVGKDLVIQKISADPQTLQADLLDRQKLQNSSDVRALLLYLSEYPQKDVQSLAREALQMVVESFHSLEKPISESAHKLLSLLSRGGPAQENPTPPTSMIRKELVSLNTALGELTRGDVKSFPLAGRSVESGFLSFASASVCREWLNEHGAEASVALMESRPAAENDSRIFVRVSGAVERKSEAAILTGAQLTAEVRELLSRMESSLLRQTNPETIQQSLFHSDGVTEKQLHRLDSLLVTMEKESNGDLGAATQSPRRLLSHVLHLLRMDASVFKKIPPSTAMVLKPFAESFVKDLSFLQRSTASGPLTLPELPLLTPEQSVSLPRESFGEFLHQHIHRFGLNLESRLASVAPLTSGQPPEDLKSTLLQLLGTLDQSRAQKEGSDGFDIRYMVENLKVPESSAAIEQLPAQEIAKMRQTAQQVLERVEALQFLARPVPTPEGDQQIMAIPMRIGKEWTELRLQIVKKDGRSSKRGTRKHYSLNVTVSPRALGEVSASIQWEEKKCCRINIGFEKRSTHNWFKRRVVSFQEALQSLGLPPIHLEMHTMRLEHESNDSHRSFHNGILDIKG